jgi:Arc/MetJ family transcription regulator
MRIVSAYDVNAMEASVMRKVSVVLDNELVQKCRKETGIQTVGALIDHALRELLRHERPKKIQELQGGSRWGDDLKKRKVVRVLDHEPSASDLNYWMTKTPEERLDTVEFLREQFYAIQGYRKIPRIKKVVNMVEMGE